jgi:hypothetical protein
LSVAYTCPYHNPAATTGHSVHNVDISKPHDTCGSEADWMYCQILYNDLW